MSTLYDHMKIKTKEIKEFSNKYYTLELIYKTLNKYSIEESIDELENRILNENYSIPIKWDENTRLYFKINKGRLLLTSSKSDVSLLSRYVYEIKFTSDYCKIEFLFHIAGGLTAYDKLMLEENNWVEKILASSRDILDDLREED